MTQQLTTLTAFKSWYNLPSSAGSDDVLLNALIQNVSLAIMNYLERDSFLKNTYTEVRDGLGGVSMMLRQWPVTALNSVSQFGQPLTLTAGSSAMGVYLDPAAAFPPGKMQNITYMNGCFQRGHRNIAINYTAGYQITNEAAKLSTAYQATAAQALGLWGQDDGVAYSSGVALTPVSSAPNVGQYNVSAGAYTFNSGDAAAAINLNYSYVPYAVQQAANQMVGELYAYRQRPGQKSRTVGRQETVAFDNSIMTAAIKMMLQPYKRMVPL